MHSKYYILHFTYYFFVLCGFILFGCSKTIYKEAGTASYYADEFHGRKTANGETFNMNDLTAAHKTLSFNSLVRVTNLENNKQVIVRINDRGPFVKGRVIDLSKQAAKKIDLISTGHAKVKLEVIGKGDDKSSGKKAKEQYQNQSQLSDNKEDDNNNLVVGTYNYNLKKEKPKGFAIQIGSYENLSNAKIQFKKAENKISEPIFIQLVFLKNQKHYRILAGEFSSFEKAESEIKSIKKKGFKGIVVEHSN